MSSTPYFRIATRSFPCPTPKPEIPPTHRCPTSAKPWDGTIPPPSISIQPPLFAGGRQPRPAAENAADVNFGAGFNEGQRSPDGTAIEGPDGRPPSGTPSSMPFHIPHRDSLIDHHDIDLIKHGRMGGRQTGPGRLDFPVLTVVWGASSPPWRAHPAEVPIVRSARFHQNISVLRIAARVVPRGMLERPSKCNSPSRSRAGEDLKSHTYKDLARSRPAGF